DGVIVASPDVITNLTHPILDHAAQAQLALAAHRRGRVEMGVLFSYAPDYAAVGPVAARDVDRIFKGTPPADLPVEEISNIDLVLNLKTAKRLGLVFPPAVVVRAAEIIG